MSKLTELLDELCPDGVARARFSDVCDYVRGVTYKKDQEVTSCALGGIKLLRANNITMGSNTLNFDDVKIVSPDVKVSEKQKLSAGDILICAGSGSREHVGKVAFIEEAMPYTFGGFMAVIRTSDNLHSRYFYHVLSSGLFKSYLQTALTSTTINNLSARIMANFTFPLPPLEVQQEIVRVLDTFTDLEESLVTELELRKKQFSEVRLALINADGRDQVPLGELLSILDSQRRPVRKSDRIPGPYPYYGANGIQDYVDDFLFEGSFVLLGEDGSVLTEDNRPVVNWAEGKIWVNNHAHVLAHKDECFDLRFAFYALTVTNIRQFVSGGSRVKLNQSGLRAIPLPVPSLEVQLEIVSKLDAFESLIQAIEREISLRRKQYEFYRDELLTFAGKEA